MLTLRVSPSVEAFRAECRQWLSQQSVPTYGGDPGLETFVRVGRQWQRDLASGRWIGTHWPTLHGGRGLSLVEEAVVQEELARVGAPQVLGLFGLTMVGPVLIQHGSDAQRSKHLAKILSADEIWCQGFSEPGAGSDLAAIRTRAEVKGDSLVITGQKIWTSFAHIADWCFVLCRTGHSGKKHQGLTYVLVPMKSPGITVRPLRQISGDDEFNEVFFENVSVPIENVVGGIGDGWNIALSTLMYERVILTFARQLQSESALRSMIQAYGDHPDPSLRARLAHEVVRACAVRALAYEHLIDYAHGKRPGPEGSLDKLFWSESFQSIAQLALEFLGTDAALNENDPHVGTAVHRYLYSRGRTIAAGTSEIQRSIIAERLMGLPRLQYLRAQKG